MAEGVDHEHELEELAIAMGEAPPPLSRHTIYERFKPLGRTGLTPAMRKTIDRRYIRWVVVEDKQIVALGGTACHDSIEEMHKPFAGSSRQTVRAGVSSSWSLSQSLLTRCQVERRCFVCEFKGLPRPLPNTGSDHGNSPDHAKALYAALNLPMAQYRDCLDKFVCKVEDCDRWCAHDVLRMLDC